MALELTKVTDVKIRLTGAVRYMHKRQLYERGKVYLVNEVDAKHLLGEADSFSGVKYFTVVTDEDLKKARAQSERARRVNELAEAHKAAFDDRVIVSAQEDEPEPVAPVRVRKAEEKVEPVTVEDDVLFDDGDEARRNDKAETL